MEFTSFKYGGKQSVSTYIEVAGSDVAAAVAAYAAVMTNDM